MTKNKIITLVFVVLAIVSLALIYIFRIRKNNKSIPVTEGVAVVPTFDDEISSDSSYCATFQLVWNDMKNEIIKKDIVFNPEEIMATNLNKESFTEDMISDSYYFKAFGPKTIKLKEEIQTLLDKFHDEGKEPNPMAKSMSWIKTNVKLILNESDKTIADLITDGCNMGVKSLNKYLNQYEAADEKFKVITKQLIDLEEKLSKDIRQFL